MKVNFAFHLEIKVWSLEEEWRGTESKLLEVQMIWGAVTSKKESKNFQVLLKLRCFWDTLRKSKMIRAIVFTINLSLRCFWETQPW